MLSHDLARLLLAHRNNDIRVEVLVDDDPAGERDLHAQWVDLRDGGTARGSWHELPADQVVAYNPDEDVVVIRAGFVVVGEPA